MLPFLVLLFALEGTSNALTSPLGSYGADADQVSVSGVSSGAYMAVQVHVAYSETIMGVGVVAGGVVEALDTYYSDFVNQSNVKQVFEEPSGHAFITDNYGNECATSMEPWINNCSYNQAYEILNHIYGGNLQKPDSSTIAAGLFYEFDQTEFVDTTEGVMNSTGYVYVPTNCNSSNSNCKVHDVSLHGCRQGKSFLEDEYALNTGYNEVADINDIIVIYPQADASPVWNPNGCWDWWGYTGINYASNLADQMKAVKAMIDRVLSYT